MLKGKIALITGAGRGIGKAIALKMGEAGAKVAIVDVGNLEPAQSVKAELLEMGTEAEVFECNVADFAAVEQLVKQVIERFGGIDILVNNAGIVRDGLMLSMKEADFDAVIGVNLKGPFNLTKHTYSHFMRKKSGRIINISSVSGITGNAGQANYASAKAGIIGLTKTTAKELASRGITCNAIAPGFIATDMTAALSEDVKNAVISHVPLKRYGLPEDIANLAVFLASDNAAYITGEVIKVDGGMCM